jgi:hypothetical protein
MMSDILICPVCGEAKPWKENVSGLILSEAEPPNVMVCKDCKIQGEVLNWQHDFPPLLNERLPGIWWVTPVYVWPNIPMRAMPDYLRFEWRACPGDERRDIKLPMAALGEIGDIAKIADWVVEQMAELLEGRG